MKKILIFLITIFFSISAITIAQTNSGKSVSINKTGMKNWAVKAFSIDKNLVLSVAATGQAQNDQWQAKAWILDSKTRQPIWEMTFDNTHKINANGTRRFLGEIELEPGIYEVYYGKDEYISKKTKGLSGLVDELFDNLDYFERDEKYSGIEIIPFDNDNEYFHVIDISEITENKADIKLAPVGDNSQKEISFTLLDEETLQIYMIGEGMRKNDQMYDYGWITNIDTRERVWEARVTQSRFGGGVDKNRVIQQSVILPAGSYTVHYITDDSHSSDMFNQMPPYDPLHWGITIKSENSDIELDSRESKSPKSKLEPIVEFTKVGNNEFHCQGFEIEQPMIVYIRTMGEYSHILNNFADYGWITNSRTRERVWSLTLDNSYHAGGSRKNRKSEDVIKLDPGTFIVCYISDDSHAYNSWNSSKPTNPEEWGIVVTPENNQTHIPEILPYSEKNDPAILASLKQVGEKEHRRKSFTLKRKTNVLVYAIGEGDKEEMYDYGWIEDSNGNTVWSMQYNETRHAGGARKNRIFNNIIELEQGRYTVHYMADDSHNYGSWNADPPDDLVYWGITIINKNYLE